MSLDNTPKPWETIDVSAHSWAPPMQNPGPSSESEAQRNMGKKRIKSVFAQSSFQPQQLQQPGAMSTSPPGYLPSAYQSLPSDASGSMNWSIPSFQLAPGNAANSGLANGSLYPQIDHTSHLHQEYAEPKRIQMPQSMQNPQNPSPTTGFLVPPAASNGFTIQCGRLSATTQRESVPSSPVYPSFSSRSSTGHSGKMRRLERHPSFANPHQLQEYYAAQSDILEGLMRNNRAMQQHIQHTNSLVSQGGDLDSEFLEILGLMSNNAPMQRANSALDAIPQPQVTGYPMLEPYMPQWQSESVPAELPNHVVNRLRMNGQPIIGSSMDRSASRRPEAAKGLPTMQNHQSLGLGDSRRKPVNPDAPDLDDLEELARTADAEVAHRAFLVPAHKKRGKGGRQPAQDPRLDPNIDERKAKRILANRLSAARSKMKQKSQMDGFGKMISKLESYKKSAQEDAAELMELCDKLERQNRNFVKDQKILEEYLERMDRMHADTMPSQQLQMPQHGAGLNHGLF